MARLNISLPHDVYQLACRWRDTVNLSEICARALREELEAVDSHRSPPGLLDGLRVPTDLELRVAELYGVAEVIVSDNAGPRHNVRDALGNEAAKYLNRNLSDGCLLAVAGGRQMWCMVRNLTPRRVRLTMTALGVEQNDPRALHVHSNSLITLLTLLYAPSNAHLVGSTALRSLWSVDLPPSAYPQYFVIASCGPFLRQSPFCELIGDEVADELLNGGAVGDFAYVFFDQHGGIISPTTIGLAHSVLSAHLLQVLCLRNDSRVVLIAGGEEKLQFVRFTLAAHLCNVLITDSVSAQCLLDQDGGGK